MYTLNCRGKIIKIDRPLVMGIINATHDSFYEAPAAADLNSIMLLAKKMIVDGADILDIGGQSTRPGSERISAGEEMKRILPVIRGIRLNFPEIIISCDSYFSAVARAAVDAGADIVNDISAGEMDPDMIATVANLKVPYVCMHMQGRPETMQLSAVYDDVLKTVLDFFIDKINKCRQAGIQDIIIDPGFGFGKNIQHNFTILRQLKVYKMLDLPILAGLSRKSTVYKTLNSTPAEALNGTTVLNTIAILNGADILRVHDVKEAKEVITLMQAYKKTAP